jgi:hypothetical protein
MKLTVGAILGVLLAASVIAITAEAAYSQASLRLVKPAPLTVRGTNFKRRETVVVTLSAGRRIVRRVVASAAGGFVVRFRYSAVGRCSSFTIQAVGLRGSRAVLKRAPLLGCIRLRR